MYVDVGVGACRFRLYPQRLVLWQQASCLLLSDLHLGKADTFRHHGIAIPQTIQSSDLERLHQVLVQAQPKRCIVLGDFLHGAIYGVETVNAWNALVAAHPATTFELVEGNHDRALQHQQWSLSAVLPVLQIGDVLLSHEAVSPADLRKSGASLNIHGHIHPAWRGSGWREKLPALIHHSPYLVLPAFSEFTAGVAQRIEQQQVWVFIEQENAVVCVNKGG